MFLNKKIGLFIGFAFVLLSVENGMAQQLPLVGQSQEAYNPAALSSEYFKNYLSTNIDMRYRYQWVGVKDAPRTLQARFAHFNEDYNISFGGKVINDQTGPTGFTGIYGKLAYVIPFSRDWLLSVGLTGGMVQYRVKGDELNFLEENEVSNGGLSKFFPDFGIGTTLYFKEKYYVGITVPQTFGLNLNYRNQSNDFNIQRIQHYYATAGAFLDLYNNSWIEPSVEVRYVQNTPLLVSAKFRYEYNQLFWVGVNGSSAKALGAEAGVMWTAGYNSNLIKLGYAFTNFLQPYGPHFGSTHEFGLTINW